MPSWARFDIWNVGIATLARPLEEVADLLPLRDVRWLPAQPPLQYIADPFPYRHGGHDWLLVELYGHRRGVHGVIARVAVDAVASAATTTPAIVRSHHVSYPSVFSDGTRTLCTPEMTQEDGCVVYRLGDDGAWMPAHHILRGRRMVDPTVFRFNGRWWLFATEPPPLHTTTLNVFHAAAVEGPWVAHAANPVKRDVASARPGGRPFVVNGRLYRPAQDSTGTYGGALHVMEVLTLTPDDFDERVALRLEPDPSWPYPDGLHHLVIDGTRVYFDAKRTCIDWFGRQRRALDA